MSEKNNFILMFINKPKVFVSGTIRDLPSERKAAQNSIESVSCQPIMSEFTMEAMPTHSVEACLNKVRTSDIYILILGGKYGWQPNDKESITELEYNAAIQKKIPIIVFNTTYPKEALQAEFEKKVESKFFRKTVSDAFELQSEIVKSLKPILEEKQKEFFQKTEFVYSNLVKIEFPQCFYQAEININKKEIKAALKEKKEKLKFKPSLFDYVVAALRVKEIRFPHDWILRGNTIYSFHDLQDSTLPLSQILDLGTAEKHSCQEFYANSDDSLSSFKHLLRRSLETKLYKQGIRWMKDENSFVFIPIQKDVADNWKPREIEWSKVKKASRTVVDIKRDLKDNTKIFNMRCLAFRSEFYLLDNVWYMSIKPEWVFLWPDLKVCDYAYKNIQWLKKNERNIHVFNHFNFILRYLQPSATESFFAEYQDYKFLKLKNIERFPFAPIIPDESWRGLESKSGKSKLKDKGGNIDLFGT